MFLIYIFFGILTVLKGGHLQQVSGLPASDTSNRYPSQFATDVSYPPSVSEFVSTFTNVLQSSPVLPNLFDLSELQPAALSNFQFEFISKRCRKVGCANSDLIARKVSEPVNQLKVLSVPVILKMYVNSLANYLSDEGVLNSANAASLAMAYSKVMEESAASFVVNDNPDSKFSALTEGFINMLKSVGAFSPEKTPDMAVRIVEEIRQAPQL
ncbi:RP1-2 domain-containing protein [Caerostris darwini]|uniref:RP1-2 domain-containing protein n=1 Tax=Caerostris darwini TaxID=1538125 RepID=A0AAV4S6Y6_9ARAC|nr:RP1-2 domain-containing protein [Caerostris darwini]